MRLFVSLLTVLVCVQFSQANELSSDPSQKSSSEASEGVGAISKEKPKTAIKLEDSLACKDSKSDKCEVKYNTDATKAAKKSESKKAKSAKKASQSDDQSNK